MPMCDSCRSSLSMLLCFYSNLNGVLVLLSDSGRLECAYLGTDPSTFSPPLPGCRELDRRRMDAEMAGLRQRMKELGQQPGQLFT